jgi:hypothetical protein
MNVEKTVAPVLPLHSNRRIAVSRAIDIRVNIDPVHWFLSPAKDTRSSLYLEDAATEFQVQGLELDWTIVTWDADLRWSGDGWSYHSFRGAKWTDVKKPERRQYLKNAYRVLLTWARDSARSIRARGRTRPDFTSCSQTRITFQPSPTRSLRVRVSRRRFRRIFKRQYSLFDFGTLLCFSHPCQKHPSTKTATLRSRKTKSGRIGLRRGCFDERPATPCLFGRVRIVIGACRLQPLMPAFRSAAATDRSVDTLPVERMEAMIWLRRDRENVSAIRVITFWWTMRSLFDVWGTA